MDRPKTSRVWERPLSLVRVALVLVVGFTALGVGAGPASAHSPHDNIVDIDVSPEFASDGTVVAISREYLLKSTDRGTTWSRLVRGLDNRHQLSEVEISPVDKQVVYAASRGDGVYKSIDGGSTWARVNAGFGGGLNIATLEASPHSRDVVFAGTLGGALFVTTTGGEHWTRIAEIRGPSAVAFAPDDEDVVLVGDAEGAVHISEDAGRTWKPTAVEGSHGRITEIAVSPAYGSDATFFAGTTRGGLVRSTDGGESFSRHDDLPDARVRSVLTSPSFDTDATMWLSTWSEGVFESTDGGDSWSRTSEGLTKNDQADLIDYPHFGDVVVATVDDPDDAPTLFLAAYDGLFRSTDGGEGWEELETQLPHNIQTVALSPNFADDSTIAVVTYLNGMQLSTDGGVSWKPINNGIAHRWAWLRRPDYVTRMSGLVFTPTFEHDNTLFSNTRGYWFVSTNGGDRWEASTPEGTVLGGAFGTDFMLVVFSPEFAQDQTLVLGTEGGSILRSTNGGRDFSLVSSLEYEVHSLVISPGFESDRTIIAGTPEGAFKSVDAGDTWAPTAELPVPVTSLAFSTDGVGNTLFAGTIDGLYTSTDAGDSWSPVAPPEFGDQSPIEAVVTSPDFQNDRMLLVSVKGRGLFKSTDGGATFRPAGQDLIANDFMISNWYHPTSEPIVFSPDFARDQTVYAFAGTNLFTSTDAGETWVRLDVPIYLHEVSEASAPNPLLAVPGIDGDGDHEGHPEGVATNTARGGKSGLEARLDDISRRELAVSSVAALVAFGLLFTVRIRSLSARWKLLLRLGAAIVVFGVVLLVQQIG